MSALPMNATQDRVRPGGFDAIASAAVRTRWRTRAIP